MANLEEMKSFVTSAMLKNGIVGQDKMDEYLSGMAEQYDRTTEGASASNLSKVEKAYCVLTGKTPETTVVIPAMEVTQSIGDVAPVVAAKTKPSSYTMPTEEFNRISELRAERASALQEQSNNMQIDKLIFDRPATDTLFEKVDTFIPEKEKALKLLDKYANHIVPPAEGSVDEDNSQKQFDKLRDLVNKGEPIPVSKSDKLTKIIGVVLLESGNKETQLTTSELSYKLTFDTAGYIQATEGHPGAQIALAKKKNGKNVDSAREDITVARIKNRDDAVKNANFAVASTPSNTEEVDYSVRSAIKFKAYAIDANGARIMKKNAKDTEVPVIRTISLSGKIKAPKLVRADQFVEKFPQADPVRASRLLDPPVGEALERLKDNHIKAISLLSAKMASGSFGEGLLAQDLKKVSNASGSSLPISAVI